jgi:predicted nucleotidyltransferase
MSFAVARAAEPVTPAEKSRIAEIASAFAGEIDAINVFGSRASGAARRGSDLDLILSGPITLYQMLRLGAAFEDSDLTFKVDLLHERDLIDPVVRDQILRQAKPLLSGDALREIAHP